MVPAPVMEVPGKRPRFPLSTVAPVLVTLEAARTAKVSAVPSMVEAEAGAVVRAAPPKMSSAGARICEISYC